MKYTQGPLTLQELPHRYDFREGKAYAIRDKRNCCVAVVGEVDAIFDGEETKANAKLYAAAPEMLEALKAMASAKDAETKYGFTDSQVAHMFKVAFDLQIAAIAKAEGK